MANHSTSPPPPPGSRAIKIPVNLNNTTDYSHPGRRRRSGRYTSKTGAEGAEHSDAGPSSLGSDQDSAWSFGTASSGRPESDRLQKTTASPALQEGNFPASYTSVGDAADNHPPQRKDKHKAGHPPPSSMPVTAHFSSSSPLGPSMLSSSAYKSINLNAHHNDPDEPPRLITYTKHSQGFTWNDELFLPSYLLGRYGERGRKKQYDADFGDEEHCPVAEIFVTDEEAQAMMP